MRRFSVRDTLHSRGLQFKFIQLISELKQIKGKFHPHVDTDKDRSHSEVGCLGWWPFPGRPGLRSAGVFRLAYACVGGHGGQTSPHLPARTVPLL